MHGNEVIYIYIGSCGNPKLIYSVTYYMTQVVIEFVDICNPAIAIDAWLYLGL